MGYYDFDVPAQLMKDQFRNKHGRLPNLSDQTLVDIYKEIGDGYGSVEERDGYRLEAMEEAEAGK